jgi:hypothetical protein
MNYMIPWYTVLPVRNRAACCDIIRTDFMHDLAMLARTRARSTDSAAQFSQCVGSVQTRKSLPNLRAHEHQDTEWSFRCYACPFQSALCYSAALAVRITARGSSELTLCCTSWAQSPPLFAQATQSSLNFSFCILSLSIELCRLLLR